MEWLDFSKYENVASKFTAELSEKGGYITFSNSGKRGETKHFTLSLETFLTCLKDIYKNHASFTNYPHYTETEWRILGENFFTDKSAVAQIKAQTKSIFATLSKIIMWANSPDYDSNNPEENIILDKEILQNTIDKIEALSDSFVPYSIRPVSTTNEENIIHTDKSVRDFAKYVFTYFFGADWEELLSETNQKATSINNVNYILHDFEFFRRIISEFNSPQNKEALTPAGRVRYFEEPVYINNGKYYYFAKDWYAEGDYDLSFSNLKRYFEYSFENYLLKRKEGKYFLIKLEETSDILFDINSFINDLSKSGLNYSKELATRFISSLLTKPFVILTGLSGSGKTKLAQAFVQWICQDESQYCIVPVGADWTNREPLLGYPNALNPKEYVNPDNGVLDLIIQAGFKPDMPHFLILDEMNLSHVERYFADFLSVMESKDEISLHSSGEIQNGIPERLIVPANLFIIGTVNIDETTNMFSPKVLDRANTIEFRISENEMKQFLDNLKPVNINELITKGAGMAKSFLQIAENKSFDTENLEKINKELMRFFGELKKNGAEFGYRSASEIIFLIHQLGILDNSLPTERKLDIAIMQKLLPKLHGSRRKLCPVLETLAGFCVEDNIQVQKDIFEKDDFNFSDSKVYYPLSLEKITRMYRSAIENGFASFAEA